MSLKNLTLETIVAGDLQRLVDNAISEQKMLDYKEELPGGKDRDKKEFLADVSSFANAAGGDLVMGVREKTGIAKEIVGLDPANLDDEKLRLENSIRDGIMPRISNISIHEVQLSNARKCLIIRIPRSWNSPHRVTFKGHDKFYSRTSAGKYPLDVAELRAIFALSDSAIQKVSEFRIDRLAKIVSDETPCPLSHPHRIVVHLAPLQSLDPTSNYHPATLLTIEMSLGQSIPKEALPNIISMDS